MQDIPDETLECRGGCGKSLTVPALVSEGKWAYRAGDLQEWLVFDTYPPGDDGIGVACSAECFAKWTGER